MCDIYVLWPFPYKNGYVLHVCCACVQWMLHMCKLHLCAAHVQASAIPHICAHVCYLCTQHVLLAHMQATGMLHKCFLHVFIIITTVLHTCRLHTCKLLAYVQLAYMHVTTVLHTCCITYNDIHLTQCTLICIADKWMPELHHFIQEDLFQELIRSFHVCCIHKNWNMPHTSTWGVQNTCMYNTASAYILHIYLLPCCTY